MELPEYNFALDSSDAQFLPTKGENQATGWDVRAYLPDARSVTIEPFEYIRIPLGFRAFCPEGWWFNLIPRSSTFVKKNLHALYGTIDENFEGMLTFAAQYVPNKPEINLQLKYDYYGENITGSECKFEAPPLVINHGDAVAQIIPVLKQNMLVKCVTNEEYNELCKIRGGLRGTGGFGSTTK